MKVYRNRYHEAKDLYEVLREYYSEISTVTLFRSKIALRRWVVTNTFNNGDVTEDCFSDEKEAWQVYYGWCRAALEHDEMMWTERKYEGVAI